MLKLLVVKFLEIVARLFCRMDKNLVTLYFLNYSGCNLNPLLEAYEKGEIKDCKFKVIELPEKPFESLWKGLLFRWYVIKWTAKSKVIVTTHGGKKLRRKTVHIELWHGFPTKKGGLMDKRVQRYDGKPDIFCSYSDFGTVLRNACVGLSIGRYVVTGAPRNDYLLTADGKKNLEKLFGMSLEGKRVVIFAPTFRFGYEDFVEGNKSYDNFFGFKEFDLRDFLSFLEENNVVFFLKLHPNEERLFLDHFKRFGSDRIRIIESAMLKRERTDFYKLLNGADLLITDYSSIYFDWLLLDRPVVFTPVDLKEYKETRGGWLLDYDFWAAGPKCVDQESLQREVKKSLEDPNCYRPERQLVLKLVHQYRDANSTKRVVQVIERALRGERLCEKSSDLRQF
ncbi:MAG: CDP-glycerol glycerophosphotransferase family protein [Pseudothermotoga sp.]|uniref:CDP-glycerol glycerophosphotransferase family protein n=1 Tax=Pseudothermotoga sp. TaxID=2033661 RepID=UPI002587C450|nr:CDP-glycerol glycerophosphotransferase family protein [Pseudothermotoga sp.]MDI6863630.1 CDP-glycerol glycerophosphotransferase family protein [Pseudothermotoga sp.]